MTTYPISEVPVLAQIPYEKPNKVHIMPKYENKPNIRNHHWEIAPPPLEYAPMIKKNDQQGFKRVKPEPSVVKKSPIETEYYRVKSLPVKPKLKEECIPEKKDIIKTKINPVVNEKQIVKMKEKGKKPNVKLESGMKIFKSD